MLPQIPPGAPEVGFGREVGTPQVETGKEDISSPAECHGHANKDFERDSDGS